MNSQQILHSLLTSPTQNLSLLEVILTFILPFFLTLPICLFYRSTAKTHNYSVEFLYSLLLFSSLTATITLLIGSNIARAFGLVAALSLIRFRTAIKSTLDAMYLFWALTIGMACGVGFYLAAILIVILGLALLALVTFVRFGRPKKKNLILKAQFGLENLAQENEFEHLLQRKMARLERVNSFLNSENDESTVVFSGKVDEKEDLRKLKSELENFHGIRRVELAHSDASLFF